MYLIRTHGNSAYLYLKLPGQSDWSSWGLEYPMDVFGDVEKSRAQEVMLKDLPDEIKGSFGFQQIEQNIEEVWKI